MNRNNEVEMDDDEEGGERKKEGRASEASL